MVKKSTISLSKAIEIGEYNPDKLSQFSEFCTVSRYSQFQLIRQAIKNREQQLRLHWAEIANTPNFSDKPYLKSALKNVEEKIEQLNKDEEQILIDYSS